MPLIVIPGLPRNPVCSVWIPAFAGMTALNLCKDVLDAPILNE